MFQPPITTNPLFQAIVIGISVYFGFKCIRIGIKNLMEEDPQEKRAKELPGVYPK